MTGFSHTNFLDITQLFNSAIYMIVVDSRPHSLFPKDAVHIMQANAWDAWTTTYNRHQDSNIICTILPFSTERKAPCQNSMQHCRTDPVCWCSPFPLDIIVISVFLSLLLLLFFPPLFALWTHVLHLTWPHQCHLAKLYLYMRACKC